ncbi:MAG: hypothetical protein H6821_05500 [Planctomycetaceae bacterium]|nr:hypothetical protein [Planctomycetaceae bacterium]MCB9940166.1 hypothetical protein [Planctomycetaceae bacterium]
MKSMSRRNYQGPSPKKQPNVALALDELIRVTENWLRRFEESWFDRTDTPATELGFNPAGELDKIPVLCDYASEAVAQLAEFANEAEGKLTDVKKEAEKRIKQKSSEGE